MVGNSKTTHNNAYKVRSVAALFLSRKLLHFSCGRINLPQLRSATFYMHERCPTYILLSFLRIRDFPIHF